MAHAKGPGTWIVLGLAVSALLSAPVLGGRKRAPIYPITETAGVEAAYHISILPPRVDYDSYQQSGAGRRLPDSPEDVSRWLRDISFRALSEKGFDVSGFPMGDPLSAGGSLARRISDLADQYVRTRRTPEASTALLREVTDGGRPQALLVLYFEVNVAPKGYWNPSDGGLGVGMSNSDLRGVLLDCRTGEALWRGEMYIRDVPDTGNDRFETAILGMYRNLTKTEGGER